MHARRCSSEIDVCTGLKMRASAAILLASSFLDFFFFSDERMEEISAAACITCAWCAEQPQKVESSGNGTSANHTHQ